MTCNSNEEKILEETNLRYVSDDIPGISRKIQGKNNTFLDKAKNIITDKKTLERAKSLAIPPAWTHVWICPFPSGHIQATGIDEKGRKQYIYHPDWIKKSQKHKFDKLIFFSEVLPSIREDISAHLADTKLTKEKILATIIWLLEHTYIRIGNTEYAKQNNHFGLTTLNNNHVTIHGSTVQFIYTGKSGKQQTVTVEHPYIAKIIRKLEELPGFNLFQYVGDDHAIHTIYSDDVNEYLKRITGEHITAKDFRTWGATVVAAEALYNAGEFSSQKEGKKNITEAVKTAAEHLRNTPSVCRTYYIHPTIIETYQKKILIPFFNDLEHIPLNSSEKLRGKEYTVKRLLQTYSKK